MIKKRQKEIFLESLENGGSITAACKKANVSRATIYRHMKNSVRFKEKVDAAQELSSAYIGDLAESKLLQNVHNNHFPSIKLVLENNHPRYDKQRQYRNLVVKEEEEYGLPQAEREEAERFMMSIFGEPKKEQSKKNPWDRTNDFPKDQKGPDLEQESQE